MWVCTFLDLCLETQLQNHREMALVRYNSPRFTQKDHKPLCKIQAESLAVAGQKQNKSRAVHLLGFHSVSFMQQKVLNKVTFPPGQWHHLVARYKMAFTFPTWESS